MHLSIARSQDWVAHTPEQYVALAVKHASQLQHLAVLRGCLRPRMLASPLCDAERFMSNLEGTYRQLWHR